MCGRLGRFMAALSVFAFFSCAEEAETNPAKPPAETGVSRTYPVIPVNGSPVSGTIKMAELDNGATKFKVKLTGTATGWSYPSQINFYSAVEGGKRAAELATIDGSSGEGFTVVTRLDTIDSFGYTQMLLLDGHIAIRASLTDTTVVAVADIGTNELSGRSVTYELSYSDLPGVTGTLVLSERLSGSTLSTIELQNAPADFDHPVRLFSKSGAEQGSVLVNMGLVDSLTGLGSFHIRNFVNAQPVTYSELLDLEGHVTVFDAFFSFNTKIAEFEIGRNALTGVYETYEIQAVNGSQISGTAVLRERLNGGSLLELQLLGTATSFLYPASINESTAAQGGSVLLNLAPVTGSTGFGRTTPKSAGGEFYLTYVELIGADAHIQIRGGSGLPDAILAAGDIGRNAP
jgi:hypothetical protein